MTTSQPVAAHSGFDAPAVATVAQCCSAPNAFDHCIWPIRQGFFAPLRRDRAAEAIGANRLSNYIMILFDYDWKRIYFVFFFLFLRQHEDVSNGGTGNGHVNVTPTVEETGQSGQYDDANRPEQFEAC